MTQKLHVGGQAHHLRLCQGLIEQGQSLLAGVAVHNEFGHHGVVIGADGVALAHAIVKAHCAAFEGGVGWLFVNLQLASGRQEIVVGVFGANARFNSVAREFDLVLLEGQRLTAGHAQLPLHQV